MTDKRDTETSRRGFLGGAVSSAVGLFVGKARGAVSDGLPKIEMGDAGSDPESNGVIARNGNRLKAYSAGQLIDFADALYPGDDFDGQGTSSFTNLQSLSTVDATIDNGLLLDEDNNSPFTATSENSITCSLAQSYDYLDVVVSSIDQAASNNNVDLTYNNNTNADYIYLSGDGTQTASANAWEQVLTHGGSDRIVERIWLREYRDNVAAGIVGPAGLVSGFAHGRHVGEPHPVDSLTFARGASTDWTVEVYGANL